MAEEEENGDEEKTASEEERVEVDHQDLVSALEREEGGETRVARDEGTLLVLREVAGEDADHPQGESEEQAQDQERKHSRDYLQDSTKANLR